MGIRFILLLIAIWIIWLVMRHFFRSAQSQKSSVKPENTQTSPGQIVECKTCGLHIPETEAVKQEGVFFCCEEHLLTYRENQKKP